VSQFRAPLSQSKCAKESGHYHHRGVTLPAEEAPMFVPVVTTIREVGASDAAANGPGSIVIEIAGATVRAQRGGDLGWLRDVLRAVKAAT
jgi:hypothetical protein